MSATRRPSVRLEGRILWLTKDLPTLERQLDPRAPFDVDGVLPVEALLDDISTDELTPAWACYYYDRTLARYCLVGLRGNVVAPGAVEAGGFGMVVSGRSKGCGSSRETAPYAERECGIRIIAAQSFEKIYRQNCHNIGLLTTTDFGVVARLARGEEVAQSELTAELDPVSRAVVESGGLFAYNRQRLDGREAPAVPRTAPRAMTIAEKIIAAHVVVDAPTDRVGVPAVAPADAAFVRTDVRFAHEYVTPMADALLRDAMGPDARIADPASVVLFRDHLTFLDEVMSEEHKAMGLGEQARKLATVQAEFARRHGVTLYGELDDADGARGSEAICHNKVIESIALPGQVVVGSDSHSCMAGAIGCLAFGIGATDMANAWITRDVRLRVPESVRIELRGRLRSGTTAKDVMLHLMALPYWRGGRGIGKVLEFVGDGVASLPLDERATLTNMAVEAGGFTGIVEADDRVLDALARARALPRDALGALVVRADPGAVYADRFVLELDRIEPMVALPGDPRSGIPVRTLCEVAGGPVRIDIAYGGSCTGGKRTDMDHYAAVLGRALERGRRVAPGVSLFIQFGSQAIKRHAVAQGYLELFERVGARVLEPSCGACIRAGPGVSSRADQVTVSAVNRNFPGRSGPGQVYLASPTVVAASAIAGRIVGPDEWDDQVETPLRG